MRLQGVRWLFVLATFPVAGSQAHAQSDCYARYDKAYQAANLAFQNIPWKTDSADADRHAVLAVQDAIITVQNWLRVRPTETEPLVCGEPLRRTEALVMIWREKGWLPTPEEQEAAARAAAVKGLNDALGVLEDKK